MFDVVGMSKVARAVGICGLACGTGLLVSPQIYGMEKCHFMPSTSYFTAYPCTLAIICLLEKNNIKDMANS